MEWVVLAISIVIVYIFYRFFFGNSVYSKIYSNEHFIELAREISKLKDKATSNVVSEVENKDVLQQSLVSSAEIRLVYTVALQNNIYTHHFSLSCNHRPLAITTSAHLVAYLLKILRLEDEVFTFSRSVHAVSHITLNLNEVGHQKYVNAPVQIVDEATVVDIVTASFKQAPKYKEALKPLQMDLTSFAMMLYQEGKTKEAILVLKRTIDNDKSIPACFSLAMIYQEQQDNNLSHKYFEKGLILCKKAGKKPEDFGIEITADQP